jgi:hypothetical protein
MKTVRVLAKAVYLRRAVARNEIGRVCAQLYHGGRLQRGFWNQDARHVAIYDFLTTQLGTPGS